MLTMFHSCIISFNFHNSPRDRYYYHTHHIDEKTDLKELNIVPEVTKELSGVDCIQTQAN